MTGIYDGVTMRRLVCASFVSALALAACAHGKEGAELSAQTGEDLSHQSYGDTPPVRPRETTSIGGPDAAVEPNPGDSYTRDNTAPGIGGTSYVAQVCPLHCFVAQGRQKQDVTAEQLERLRGALAPTMNGLRQCAGGWADTRRNPIVNLRFNSAGDLMDLGVDTTGFEASADDCMQQVARGSTRNPSIKFEAPGTVRCAERCEKKPRWTTPPR